MIAAFLTPSGWLDYSGALSLELRSPFFQTDSIPGLLSYPIAFEDTPANRRKLNFPATRTRQVAKPAALDTDLYMDGLLYRRGKLTYLYAEQGKLHYRFEADADALGVQIDGRTVPDLLTTESVAFTVEPSTDDYVLAPIRSATLYGDRYSLWGKVINYYDASGAYPANAVFGAAQPRYTFVPLLRVLPLLRRCLAAVGYTLAGTFTTDTEIADLVLVGRTTTDMPASSVDPVADLELKRYAPSCTLGEFLVALQQVFCLGYIVDTVAHTLTITPLREVARNLSVIDRTDRARANYRDEVLAPDGFLLAYDLPSDDEQFKLTPVSWAELRIGNGGEEIRASAAPLVMVTEVDPLDTGRQWLVPAMELPARSDFYEDMVENTDQPLRLLFYRGLQPDSNADDYPLASSGNTNYDDATVGDYTLHWDGAAGLYEQWHKPWLDFRAAARQEERDVLLTAGDLLTLHPAQKEMVDHLKFLWERVSISANGVPGAGVARILYHQIAT